VRKGQAVPPEVREKRRAAMNRPEVREKLRAAQQAASAKPEVREKRRAAQLAAWANRNNLVCAACRDGNCLACDGGGCRCVCSLEMDRKVVRRAAAHAA